MKGERRRQWEIRLRLSLANATPHETLLGIRRVSNPSTSIDSVHLEMKSGSELSVDL